MACRDLPEFKREEVVAELAAGWAISRGTPAPVPFRGGYHIEVGLPDQKARYVFPELREEVVRPLAASIDEPFVYLKFCAPRDAVAALLPDRWSLADPGYLMAADAESVAAPGILPEGHRASIAEEAGVVALSIATADGEPAARGRMVPRGRLAVFDRIETEEAHRRRGLGSVVMGTLGGEALRRGADRFILAATPAGRMLYLSLGWRVLSDYSTAFIPG